MKQGDYKCPYCGDICNEMGIKTHIMKQHPQLHEEFGFKHLNKFPLGHDLHAKEEEKLIKKREEDELAIIELDNPAPKNEQQQEKTENVFEKEQEKKEAEKITKEDVLGVTQTYQTPQEKTEADVIIYACGNCEASVTENMQTCPNCGAPLNWQDVE